VEYAFALARAVSRANAVLRVKGSPPVVAVQRLALFSAARCVMGSVLRLLGLRPLERM